MTTNDKGKKRTLEDCFLIFQIIHQLTASPEDILMVAKYVIKEISEDGVKYLELRSTPRRENATGKCTFFLYALMIHVFMRI